jgi:hypothetical protein
MNNEDSRPGSSGSTSAHFPTRPPSQDMRAKAGEATLNPRRRASGERSSEASGVFVCFRCNQTSEGFFNMQVGTGADLVDHVADSGRTAADCLEQNVPQLAGLVRHAAIGPTASRKTCATKPWMTSSKWRRISPASSPRWCLASLRSSASSRSACSKAVRRKNLRSNSVGPSALRVASGNSLADRTVADDPWHMISETPCSGRL